MTNKRVPLALTIGDPAGIGPETEHVSQREHEHTDDADDREDQTEGSHSRFSSLHPA